MKIDIIPPSRQGGIDARTVAVGRAVSGLGLILLFNGAIVLVIASVAWSPAFLALGGALSTCGGIMGFCGLAVVASVYERRFGEIQE